MAERTHEEIAERLRELGHLVRAGELTPKQVDDGLPLKHDGGQDLHDITSNSVWWLPQTLLFYAWQDLARTREEWRRFTLWGRDLWRDAPGEDQINTFDEAEALLRSDLSAGIVRAFGRDAGGTVQPIPHQAWNGLAFSYGWNFEVVDTDGATAYSTVFMLRHEVVPLLIAEHPGTTPAIVPEPRNRPDQLDRPATKRGRKPDPEVDRFWIEIHKATSSGKYGSQKSLIDHMMEWANGGQCTYDADTVRKKVGALYREMGWRNGSAD